MNVKRSITSGRDVPSVFSIVVLVSLGVYAFFDLIVLGVAGGQRAIYAAILASVLLALAAQPWRYKVSGRIAAAIALWMLLSTLWLLPVAGFSIVYPVYVFGDTASIVLPAMFLMAGLANPGLFTSRLTWQILGCFCLGGVLVATASGVLLGQSRFEPPHIVLLGLAGVILTRGSFGGRALSIALLVICLVSAYLSGSRTALIVWLLGALYVAYVSLPLKVLLPVIALSTVLFVSFSQDVVKFAVERMLQETRFRENVEGKVDASIISRFSEARDVLDEFNRSPPGMMLIGKGHGATYAPVTMPLRNVTDEGRVHNIHFSPMLILYRYGIIGFIFYAALLITSIAMLIRHRQIFQAGHLDRNDQLYTLMGGLYLASGIPENVFVDPLFSFVLAGFLLYRLAPAAVSSYFAVLVSQNTVVTR